ncbi:hypothetical protein [Parasitella parasitica]|uniref:Uncharacterized protein n=1 Tax=Parasitella parasitica TaxID=35722 RepID=A0A0B7NW51_9FUNG|nr:hypothetical protein [Parasitella parasitica]
MPPNVALAAPTSSGLAPSSKEDQDQIFTWDEVYHYVSTNQIKSIHRSKQVQTVYNQWMRDTLSKYGSIENYLLSTKLHFEPIQDKDRPPVIILPNDFPYSVEKGIQHILLWSQIPLSRDYIEHILESNYGSANYEWVYFVNPPEIQSVRKLPHVHVFMRQRIN